MSRHLLRIAALVAAGFAATAAHADVTYGFGTVDLAPQGRLSGSFVVTEADIADGTLTGPEMAARANFSFTDAAAPLQPATFTPTEFGTYVYSPYYGEIYVDRVSGEPYAGLIEWRATDTSTGQV
ncbi:MAG TPA: hypothetical protein VJ724_04630, partial [Tahibacter sp.]|nr:hypothetical protein [Tahibacter sp.]